MSWQWQDDHLWQSCSKEAKQRAQTFMETPDVFPRLTKLAAQQPFTAIASDAATLAACHEHARALKQVSSRMVVIGTGGSTLGGTALCAVAPDPGKVRFLENCDPVTLAAFLRLERETTSWCLISKSGETAETLSAALSLIAHYQGHEKDLARRVRVITIEQDSSLMKLARTQHWTVLPHPPTLGGRFSVFSVVGLLPAAYAGIDIDALAIDAQEEMRTLLKTEDKRLLAHAAWLTATMEEKPMHVTMGYADRLKPAVLWHRQIWAESLGKDGKGSTPINALGAIDQHSQLQLYLGGPRDKTVTLWLPDTPDDGRAFPSVHIPGLEYLAGRHMSDVMKVSGEATAATLAKNGVPLRVLRGALSPSSLAKWMARMILETLLTGMLMGVNPYDQPAVEEGKILAREKLLAMKERK